MDIFEVVAVDGVAISVASLPAAISHDPDTYPLDMLLRIVMRQDCFGCLRQGESKIGTDAVAGLLNPSVFMNSCEIVSRYDLNVAIRADCRMNHRLSG